MCKQDSVNVIDLVRQRLRTQLGRRIHEKVESVKSHDRRRSAAFIALID
jgi:hypothetical protein